MELTALPKIIKRPKKRVGRGYGSGKGGHSSGRGFKGQHARNSVAIWFEGGQLPLIKRLPFQRGKGRFNSLHAKPVIVTLNQLNVLPVGSVVTVELLVKHTIITAKDAQKFKVKILNTGKLTKRLTVSIPTSAAAAAAIKKVS